MAISFVTMQQNKNSAWELVQKSFPTPSEGTMKWSVSTAVICRNKDKSVTEVAAKEFASLNELPYVPENHDVLTIKYIPDGYLAVRITPNGNILGASGVYPAFENALKEVMARANKENSIVILPQRL